MKILQGKGLNRCILLVILALTSCPPLEQPPIRFGIAFPSSYHSPGRPRLTDGRFIGLAFSSGGSRPAVFGAAAMRELDRVGLLPQVDVISSVSGGILPAVAYVLEGYR